MKNLGVTSQKRFSLIYGELCIGVLSCLPGLFVIKLDCIVLLKSTFLNRVVMPMMQSFIKAGDFTVKGKLKSALIDNAIYYGSYLFICGILLIYLALKPGIDLNW